MKEVKFIQTKDGDEEDYTFLRDHEVKYTKGTADRLLKALLELDVRGDSNISLFFYSCPKQIS
jgi:hypothetical protein